MLSGYAQTFFEIILDVIDKVCMQYNQIILAVRNIFETVWFAFFVTEKRGSIVE